MVRLPLRGGFAHHPEGVGHFEFQFESMSVMAHNRHMTENLNLHAHVSTFSPDGDGGHGHDYTVGFNADETGERERAQGINDFSDIHFMQRVMMNVASPYAVEYGMTVKVDSEGIEVHENTDEGFRDAEVRWCRDADCDPAAESRYDEYAEMMGY